MRALQAALLFRAGEHDLYELHMIRHFWNPETDPDYGPLLDRCFREEAAVELSH